MLAAGALVLGASVVVAQGTITFAGKEDVSVPIRDGSGATTVVVVNGGEATTIDWSVQLDPAKDGTARTADVDPPQSPLAARAPNTQADHQGCLDDRKALGRACRDTDGDGHADYAHADCRQLRGAVVDRPSSVVLLVLFVSLIVLAVRYLTLDAALKGPLTNPKWSYSSTWTASFAGAGALLATIVASGALPSEPYLLTKAEFAGLAILFGALGVLAPVVFSALNGERGSIEVFHLATWLSTAAVIGQLTTIMVLLADALGQGTSDWFVSALFVMEAVAVALIFIYIYRGVPKTIEAAKRESPGIAPRAKPTNGRCSEGLRVHDRRDVANGAVGGDGEDAGRRGVAGSVRSRARRPFRPTRRRPTRTPSRDASTRPASRHGRGLPAERPEAPTDDSARAWSGRYRVLSGATAGVTTVGQEASSLTYRSSRITSDVRSSYGQPRFALSDGSTATIVLSASL